MLSLTVLLPLVLHLCVAHKHLGQSQIHWVMALQLRRSRVERKLVGVVHVINWHLRADQWLVNRWLFRLLTQVETWEAINSILLYVYIFPHTITETREHLTKISLLDSRRRFRYFRCLHASISINPRIRLGRPIRRSLRPHAMCLAPRRPPTRLLLALRLVPQRRQPRRHLQTSRMPRCAHRQKWLRSC